MPGARRQWQIKLEVSDHPQGYIGPDYVCLYEETVDGLLATVKTYLHETKPHYFSNGGDYLIGRFEYYHSEGEPLASIAYDDEFEIKLAEGKLGLGWWCREKPAISGPVAKYATGKAIHLMSFEGVMWHFMNRAIIIEKGPDYQSGALVESDLQLHLLEKVLREKDENPVNDLIRRGWHIIALEYQGIVSRNEELVNRQATFVLGHADIRAAQQTFEAQYYRDETAPIL